MPGFKPGFPAFQIVGILPMLDDMHIQTRCDVAVALLTTNAYNVGNIWNVHDSQFWVAVAASLNVWALPVHV